MRFVPTSARALAGFPANEVAVKLHSTLGKELGLGKWDVAKGYQTPTLQDRDPGRAASRSVGYERSACRIQLEAKASQRASTGRMSCGLSPAGDSKPSTMPWGDVADSPAARSRVDWS